MINLNTVLHEVYKKRTITDIFTDCCLLFSFFAEREAAASYEVQTEAIAVF